MTKAEFKRRVTDPIFVCAMVMFVLGMFNAWQEWQRHKQHKALDALEIKRKAEAKRAVPCFEFADDPDALGPYNPKRLDLEQQ